MLKRILTATAAGGVMAMQVQAVTLFTEDFETHNSGHSMDGINGWSSEQVSMNNIAECIVNDIPGVLDGNYGDGTFRLGPTQGSAHVNDAGISGGLDTNLTYTLAWTWANIGDSSHNSEFGFSTTGNVFGVRLSMEGGFNCTTGVCAGHMRLLARNNGEDGAGWPGDNMTNDFEIRISAAAVGVWRDGNQVAGRPMDPDTMASVDGIFWFHDTSASRNAGQIDNIVVSDSTVENLQPVSISTGTVDNVVQFEFESQAGFNYTVEGSANLVNWTPISTTPGQGGTQTASDPEGSDGEKVYRVVEGQ